MKKTEKMPGKPEKRQTVDAKLPELSRIAHKNMGFTILEDKVIIICDKSYAGQLLGRGRDKGLPPS